MKFLSYDSPFGQFLIKLCYSCCLNLLWFICCIPIFTIGASTTALYYASLKIVKDEDYGLTRMFFRSFRENFRQSTILWLILLAVGLLLAGDGYVVYRLRAFSTGPAAVMWTLVLALLIAAAIAYTIVLLFVFPLVASVSNTNWAMLKNSFFIGTHYLFCTILVFAVHFAMFFAVVRIFTPLIVFGEGLCALLSSFLMSGVLRACSYDPNAESAEETGTAESTGQEDELPVQNGEDI